MKTNKELYQKNILDGWKNADLWCIKYAPDYYEARVKKQFEKAFSIACQKISIELEDTRFIYFLDANFLYPATLSNVTPNYDRLIQNGLTDLYMTADSEYAIRQNTVVDSMMVLTERIVLALENLKPVDYEKKIKCFEEMKNGAAKTFADALQRVLFLNQLLWQTGSRLIGLGRLDMSLFSYYQFDVENNGLTSEEAYKLIKDFLITLHKYYWFKSNVLLGDTGQVIVLGGSDELGNYISNELTELFIKAVKELQQSEPKIVLRVNQNMPQHMWELALNCMATGVGSPLLSNDDVIISQLVEFGVEKEDALCYATSACWEPLIYGKSSSMNNERGLCFMDALNSMFLEENLYHLYNFEMLKERYFYYLKRQLEFVKKEIYALNYDKNPLYSMFLDGCKESEKDFSEGGAKYHNVGMTTVSLGNTINALFNIKKYVFEEKRYSLIDVKKMCVLNFNEYEDAIDLLKINAQQYGLDNHEVIDLSNEILQLVTKYTKDFRTPIKGKLKFGVSSPSYIIDGTNAKASFDGRKEGEPYMVHISNENIDSYTEILRFAASLDYGENRFNGNVVDLMVSPSFIENHMDKMITLLKAGFCMGVFQLQMNVVSSAVLIEAKKNPDRYPNLVVRVWGFSAYFTELPESYQDVLIARALKNEGK